MCGGRSDVSEKIFLRLLGKQKYRLPTCTAVCAPRDSHLFTCGGCLFHSSSSLWVLSKLQLWLCYFVCFKGEKLRLIFFHLQNSGMVDFCLGFQGSLCSNPHPVSSDFLFCTSSPVSMHSFLLPSILPVK